MTDINSIVLGRPQVLDDIENIIALYKNERVLITGACGSIGEYICQQFEGSGVVYLPTDIIAEGDNHLDVTDRVAVDICVGQFRPTIILHIAGAKHAPDGEINPCTTYDANIVGTNNVLRAANRYGAKMVLASTCKACNPETHYGATKMVMEKLVTHDGHYVARFYNVIETSGNVFEIWDKEWKTNGFVTAYDAKRFFISLGEAGQLVMKTPFYEPGKYTVYSGTSPFAYMPDIANRLYCNVVQAPRRLGDRKDEPMCGTHEFFQSLSSGNFNGFAIGEHVQIISRHESPND